MSAGLLDLVPVLPALRVLAVATAFPLLAGPGSPRMVRLGVGLSLAVLVLQTVTPGPTLSAQALLLVVPFELMLGLALGYVFSLPFDMLAVAGDLLGQEMGLNTATQFDPVTGRPVPLLSRLFELLGLVLFVEAGGLQLLLRTLAASFEAIPSGSIADPPRLFAALVEASTRTISVGVELALPVAAVLMLVTVATTFIARSVPKLHVLDFAYAVRLMLAMFLVAVLLPRVAPAFSRFTGNVADRFLSALVGP